jgi:hypothetical protein
MNASGKLHQMMRRQQEKVMKQNVGDKGDA